MEKSAADSSFYARMYNPFLQGTLVFALVVVGMLTVKGLNMADSLDVAPLAYWMIAGTGLLFFAMFNSVISLAIQTNMNQYWSRSTGTYAVLMLLGGGLAYLFSSLTIGEAGTFRWIFMVLTFGYLLFLSIMRFIRKIVIIAQEEDNKWMNRMK